MKPEFPGFTHKGAFLFIDKPKINLACMDLTLGTFLHIKNINDRLLYVALGLRVTFGI